MSDICQVCGGTGMVTRVDNYGVPDPVPSRCPACVTSTTASNTSAPTSDPEAAAEVMYQAACSGLWYTNPNAAGSVMAIQVNGKRYPIPVFDEDAELTLLRAEVQALREDKAMLDWMEANFEQVFQKISSAGFFYFCKVDMRHKHQPTLRDAIRAAMKGEK